MADKIRGIIAVLVGLFAVYQGYQMYHHGLRDWHLWVESLAGAVLIALGIWRLLRKPFDPASELLK
jgi:ABC-type nickel/cobalt efflux system permease component RcnA